MVLHAAITALSTDQQGLCALPQCTKFNFQIIAWVCVSTAGGITACVQGSLVVKTAEKVCNKWLLEWQA